MTRSIYLTAVVALSVLLGACASTPPTPAADTAATAAATPAATEAPKPAAETQPAGQTPPAAQAADSTPAQAARSSMPAQRSVYYDFDKYALKSEYASVVQANVEYLKDNAGVKVRIEGNCDERGSRSYNLALGQRRADAVKNAMKLLGVAEQRMETVSYGEEKPKAAGHGETAWAENRRSDIVYQGN
ncbi:MAG: peptidoglycan-associated lipoprotein Pal [Betaproteobacteria bacterium]|nr:peptidoglycan-associated lipoprotein Pal [Betaproteobacteria bacterium]